MLVKKLGLLALSLCACAGCSDGKFKTYPVSGKVTYNDGEPFAGGSIQFESTLPAAQGLNAQGVIQPDGTFKLSTYGDGDGAIEGEHRVIVAPLPYWETPTPDAPPTQAVLDPKYRSYSTSGLKFTVKAGENDCQIAVERPK